MESFQELSLPAFLHDSLRKMKFVKPTPIQAQSIPSALQGKDIIASAETGSGKTAAFGIPLLAFLEANRDRMALVLVPTRELADQVREVLKQLAGGRHELSSALLIGGMGMGAQVDSLRRGARLIIGTPGRINDHLQQKTLNLSRTGFLVLDEADRMLDMGFAPQLDRIRQHLTSSRQTLLFSATIPPDIQKMASLYLKEPFRVAVGTNARPVDSIRQAVLHTSQARKIDDLMDELKTREGSVLIFGRTQHRVDRLSKKLKETGFANVRIHGGRTQGQRRMALEDFKSGKARILVATDIAARGLDISHIAHVINFDLPQVAEDYVHRVGRTARAGAKGDSLSLLTPEDKNLWREVLRTLGSAQSVIITLPSHYKDHVAAPHPSKQHTGGPRASHGQPRSGHQGKPSGPHGSGRPDSRRSDRPHPHGANRDARPATKHPVHGAPRHESDKKHSARPQGEPRDHHRGPSSREERPASGQHRVEHKAPHARPSGDTRSHQGRDDRRPTGNRPSGNRTGDRKGPHDRSSGNSREPHRGPHKREDRPHGGAHDPNASDKVKKWFKRLF
jgi:ATP-dependent RNA helicase DeaD